MEAQKFGITTHSLTGIIARAGIGEAIEMAERRLDVLRQLPESLTDCVECGVIGSDQLLHVALRLPSVRRRAIRLILSETCVNDEIGPDRVVQAVTFLTMQIAPGILPHIGLEQTLNDLLDIDQSLLTKGFWKMMQKLINGAPAGLQLTAIREAIARGLLLSKPTDEELGVLLSTIDHPLLRRMAIHVANDRSPLALVV